MKAKIYVACSSREIDRAERAMASIRAAGGEVTFDWTADVRTYGSKAPDATTGMRCATADLAGVETANVVLVLDGEYSYGRIVEHGAALALRKPVVVSGVPQGRIWETLDAARVSGDDEAVILALALAHRIALAEEQCEWNPGADRPAQDGDEPHAPAAVGVGSGKDNWHLCHGCADLPRFARKRRRRPLQRATQGKEQRP